MTHQATRTFTDMARPIVDPLPADVRGWLFTGIGGFFEAVLLWGHHRFYWWPLHPLGFIVSVGWLAGQVWFSVFIAWALKLGIVKWGGCRSTSGPSLFSRIDFGRGDRGPDCGCASTACWERPGIFCRTCEEALTAHHILGVFDRQGIFVQGLHRPSPRRQYLHIPS